MTVEQAAQVVIRGDAAEIASLRNDIGSDTEGAAKLLAGLSDHADPSVRDWAGQEAMKLLGPAAIDILAKLAEDPHPDVRSEAMRSLVTLDRRWVSRLTPKYLKLLRAKRDPLTVVDAIWRLVQFRERAALPILSTLATSAELKGTRNHARVAALVLNGDEAALLEGLSTHDHKRMLLWTKGLAYLGTPSALDALVAYSHTAPDPECRAYARRAFEARDAVQPIARN